MLGSDLQKGYGNLSDVNINDADFKRANCFFILLETDARAQETSNMSESRAYPY
jgi:hypothetical protein